MKLAESSEPANGTLNFLRQQRLSYARNMIIGHPDASSMKSKCFDIKERLFNETEICLISEIEIDDSFPYSQFSVNGQENGCFQETEKEVVDV